jgi:multidrug resistance efflux pump
VAVHQGLVPEALEPQAMAEVDENHSFQQQLNNLQRELEEFKEQKRVSDAKFSDQQCEIDALKAVVRDDGEWSPLCKLFP